MRLTVLQQTAKGSPEKAYDSEGAYPLRDPVGFASSDDQLACRRAFCYVHARSVLKRSICD
jgi:hypothetical protein